MVMQNVGGGGGKQGALWSMIYCESGEFYASPRANILSSVFHAMTLMFTSLD